MTELERRDADLDAASPLRFNPEDYRDELDSELTKAQQDELLAMLWRIMEAMVHIGWGVDNIQLMIPELFNRESASDKQHTIENSNRKDAADAK